MSGTYTIQLGPNILDQFGEPLDTNQNAGLAVLRDQSQNSPTTTVQYTAADLPKAIPGRRLAVPEPGELHDRRARQLPHPGRHDLLGGQRPAGPAQPDLPQRPRPDGDALPLRPGQRQSAVTVTLFSSVGNGTTTANFTNTVFDDNAATPIQNGSAPFFATFNPQQSLATGVRGPCRRPGDLDAGHRERLDDRGHRHAQRLVADLPEATADHGLGEPGSDNVTASFRIFTLGQTNALSSQAWTAVGPASIGSSSLLGGEGSPRPVGPGHGLAIDPSDPSGNTVYVAGASGGIWKTTNFLTTSPRGPTWIPLTDFGPTSGVNIGGIAVFGRNHDPNQSIVIAATGEGDTGTPGRRLPDLAGRRRDLEPSRQHQQRRCQRQPAADQLDRRATASSSAHVVQGRRRSPGSPRPAR